MLLVIVGVMSFVFFVVNVEVVVLVVVFNMYLWCGYDLGNGSVVVFGDFIYFNSGFYIGLWVFLGDSSWGIEYDLFVGYGVEFSGFSVDLSFWNYMYLFVFDEVLVDIGGIIDDFGGLIDVVLLLGFVGFSVMVYDNIVGGLGNVYYIVGYSYDVFLILVGKYDIWGFEIDDDGFVMGSNMIYVNVSYVYNDNFLFILSQQIDGEVDDDLKFVLNYSLLIDG